MLARSRSKKPLGIDAVADHVPQNRPTWKAATPNRWKVGLGYIAPDDSC